MKYLLLILAMTGCSEGHKQQVIINQTFQTYVNGFISDGNSQGKPITVIDLIIEFNYGMPTNQWGVCTTGYDKTPTIDINADVWKTASDTFKEELLYHELGHCLLYRKHVTALYEVINGVFIQQSVMYPSLADQGFYIKYRQYYIEELFKGTP